MIVYRPNISGLDAVSLVTIDTPANGLSITGDQILAIALASTSTTGALSDTDWNTFNGKQPAGNYITALTGDATATGPGSASLTLATVNSNVGSFGSTTSVPSFTVNAKGLITAASGNTLAVAGGGTGVTSTTAYALLAGGTSSTNPLQSLASVGTAGQILTSNGAAALPTFQTAAPVNNPDNRSNYSLALSVAANALTIELKDAAGSDPSAGSPVLLSFRDTTATVANYTSVAATAATSLVIPSGTTIGTASGKLECLYVYAINNAGTIVLGVSLTPFDAGFVQSSSAISGGSSAATLYSTAAQTSKAIRFLGVLYSNQVTAGTWALVPSQDNLLIMPRFTLGSQQIFTASGTWTRPSGCRAVRVTVVGGGGAGGGNGANDYRCGAGGAGAATAFKFLTYGFGATETITVGAGGVGDENTGGDGGQSAFGSLVTADGGAGGAGNVDNNITPGTDGQTTTTGADYTIPGGAGAWAMSSSTVGLFVSGQGGNSPFGSGGAALNGNSAAGKAASGYGAGGGGTCMAASATARNGGNGSPGLILVEEFY